MNMFTELVYFSFNIINEVKIMSNFVKVIKGGKPWKSAYDAIDSVFEDDAKGKRVLLKPSVGFEGKPKVGLSTHPEVIRGLIRYFQDKEASEIIVGDSSVIGVDTMNAIKCAGILEVCEEEEVNCIDLNSSDPVKMQIKNGVVVDSILLSSIVYEVDYVISVPVMKTHMYTGASLSIKNMKGSMYKREKNKLHRIKKATPKGATARALDYGIMDLTTVCYPDYSVIDGTVGMEGFGPSGGTPKEFGCIVASKSAISADMTAMKLMGLTLDDVGHIRLIAERDQVTHETIDVDPKNYEDYSTKFITPALAKLGLKCDALEFIDESACSGCHAALNQFMRYHSSKFEDSEKIYLFSGKDLNEEEIIEKGDKAFLVGNCSYKFRNLAPICKGCPPVDSEILKMVKGQTGVTIEYFGYSSLNISTKDYNILIDPFLRGNALVKRMPEDIKATHVCVTHAHENHFGDAIEISKMTGAEVYVTEEIADQVFHDVKTVAGNIGAEVKTEFGFIKFVNAVHSAGVPGGIACGFLLDVEGVKVYHAGDTALTFDMKLLEKENIDVAILPIGGSSTMTPNDAIEAIKFIKPKNVIPMNYNTCIQNRQDEEEFKANAEEATNAKVHILKPSDTKFFE